MDLLNMFAEFFRALIKIMISKGKRGIEVYRVVLDYNKRNERLYTDLVTSTAFKVGNFFSFGTLSNRVEREAEARRQGLMEVMEDAIKIDQRLDDLQIKSAHLEQENATLKERVISLERENKDLKKEVSSLKGEMSTLKEEVTTFKSEMKIELHTAKCNYETQISNLKRKIHVHFQDDSDEYQSYDESDQEDDCKIQSTRPSVPLEVLKSAIIEAKSKCMDLSKLMDV